MLQIQRFVALLSFWSVIQHNVISMWTDLDIIKVESLNGSSSLPFNIDVRPKRIKRGLFGLSGIVYITDYFDDYMMEVIVMHSVARNNVYKLLPIRVPEGPLCAKFNNEYRTYVMKDLHTVSDLPYSEDAQADLCPLFAKDTSFEVKSFQFNKNTLPKFLVPGLYKLYFLLKRQNDSGTVLGGIEVISDLA